MVFKKLKVNKFLILILLGYFLVVYLPYILKGGFIIDDWGVPYLAHSTGSFWQNYTAWFPLFSNRPVAPLVLTIFSRLYGTWPLPYIITNLFFWSATLLITGYVIKKYTRPVYPIFFFFFGLLPVTATTVIFSPVMQLTATFSFFVWAGSFFLLDRHLNKKNGNLLVLSYALILVGLLTYEIILPLLVINFLWPWLVKVQIQKPPAMLGETLVKSISPLIEVTILVLVMQKLIMPRYMPVVSRLDFNPAWGNISQLFWSWLHAGVNDFFTLLYSAVIYPDGMVNLFLLFCFLVVIIGSIFYLKRGKLPEEKQDQSRYIFIIFILAFFASSVLYILSGRTAQVIGYENRGMSATWFTLALLLALGSSYFFKKKLFYFFPGLLALCFIAFQLISHNYILSAQLQKTIISDCNAKITASVPPCQEKLILLANVPHFTTGNFLNEEVFYYFWDFGYAMSLKNQRVSGGNTLTLDKIIDQKVRLEGENIYLEEGWSAPIENAWYYEYNQFNGQSKLLKVDDQSQLEGIITGISNEPNIVSPPSFFWQTRDLILNDPNYFQNYFNRP